MATHRATWTGGCPQCRKCFPCRTLTAARCPALGRVCQIPTPGVSQGRAALPLRNAGVGQDQSARIPIAAAGRRTVASPRGLATRQTRSSFTRLSVGDEQQRRSGMVTNLLTAPIDGPAIVRYNDDGYLPILQIWRGFDAPSIIQRKAESTSVRRRDCPGASL